MYLVDTPGVLPPKLGDVETGMKLALCGEVEAVAWGGFPKRGFQPQLGLLPEAGVGVCCLQHPHPGSCVLPGCQQVARGQQVGWPGLGAGLDRLFQEPSVTTWWGRTSWPTTSCTS